MVACVLLGVCLPAQAGLFGKKDEKRQPKPETCVAFAIMHEQLAYGDDVEPAARMELLESARRAYQQALEIDAGHLPAYCGLGRVYMNMDHCDKADEIYQRGLQKFPKDVWLWHDRGICFGRMKKWEQALQCFQKAHELDPENRAVTNTLGLCLARTGRFRESFDVLLHVMRPAEAHCTLARMMHHLQRDDLCRQELAQALRLNPDLKVAKTLQAALNQPQPSRSSAEIRFEEGQ
jgi:tetratricopeptide (TPR) repeat protein